MNRLTLNSQITVTLFTELFCVDFDFIFEIQFLYENFSYTLHLTLFLKNKTVVCIFKQRISYIKGTKNFKTFLNVEYVSCSNFSSLHTYRKRT